MAEYRLETALKNHFTPILRADGFSGSGRVFRRIQDGLLSLVQVQGSRSGGSFAVNLAIQPIGIPDAIGDAVDPRRIVESGCRFRRRMSEADDRVDQWWDYADSPESMDAAVLDAATVYASHGRGQLAQAERALYSVTPEQLDAGTERLAGFTSSPFTTARALAEMRMAAGAQHDARSFAAYALSKISPAVGGMVRRELERLAGLA